MSNKRVNPFKVKIHLLECEIEELKQQLAKKEELLEESEECKEFNAEMWTRFANKCKDLTKQLAEKEKEIKDIKDHQKDLCLRCGGLTHIEYEQDKILFAVEQLDLLYKTLTTESVWRAFKKGWWLDNGECKQLRQTIDNQIKQLKKGK